MSQEPLNTKIFRALAVWQRETKQTGTIGTPVSRNGFDWPLMWVALDSMKDHHIFIYTKETTGEVTVYPMPKGYIIQEEIRWKKDPAEFVVEGSYGSYITPVVDGHFNEDMFLNSFDLILELINQSEKAGKLINIPE